MWHCVQGSSECWGSVMSKQLRMVLLGAMVAAILISQLLTSSRRLALDNEVAQADTEMSAPETGVTAGQYEVRPTGNEPLPSKKPAQAKVTAPAKPGQVFKGKMLLDEDFDGHSLDRTRWNTCHWWGKKGCTIASNDELEWYLPEQVKVADGALHLTAEKRTVYGSDGHKYAYASAMVTTGPPTHDAPAKLAFTYGSIEVRFKVPEGQGLWPAVWLLPESTESVPEIDMLEKLGHDPGTLRMHLHPKDRSLESEGQRYYLPEGKSLSGEWHTMGLDWKPNQLVFWLDGEKVWEFAGSQVPDEPMYVVMNLAVGGNYPGSPDSTTSFPATFVIDRIRIQGNN